MKFDLSGKKTLVTGGSSGIGKAIVETLTKQGATVFVIDLNENPAHTLRKKSRFQPKPYETDRDSSPDLKKNSENPAQTL